MKEKVFYLLAVFLFFTPLPELFAERERFVEENGRIVIEAENFHRQFRMGVFRYWYTLPEINRTPEPNPDPFHSGASGGEYLKALPFTRVTPEDTLIENLNFFEEGNEAPRLEYDVLISDPGRYYVWVRAYPTGSENNSIHVGYNDIWPETGKAVQWCGSSGWTWSGNRKLDDNPCGSRNGAYLDLSAGPATIIFSMREDGFEFDKFILVKDPEYTPSGTGPDESTIINRCQDGVDNSGNGLIDCDDPVCMIYDECRLPLKGRIAISSDGNGTDPDDIGASATMFAILSSQNLKHKLVHKDYGNYMKGISEEVWVEMQKTMTEGIELFDLNPDVFFNDQEDFNGAVDNLRKEINKSSMSDPLTIIHAGSLSVIGEAIQQAEPDKRKYATVISHSWWNDYNHSPDFNDFYYEGVVGFVKDDLIKMGVQWIQIMDQNWHLNTKRDGTPWTFLRDADDPRLNWIHERIVTARDIMWTKYDISDAGMLYFAITGDEEVTPQKLQEMLIPESAYEDRNKNSIVFPAKEWKTSSPEYQGVSSAKMMDALNYLKSEVNQNGIDEVLVIRNGYVIFEGTNTRRTHSIWSCGKTFTSAVLGLMIKEGLVSLDDNAADYEPVLTEHYPEVTFRHFTTMTSGYDAVGKNRWDGVTEDWSWTPYDPGEPLFVPGTEYAYWDEAMMMFGRVLTKILNRTMESYLKEKIGDQIGMPFSWVTEGDIDGLPINMGGGNVELNAKNFARWGLLFLNKGNWDGKQLINPEWVKQATSVQVPSTIPVADTDRKRSVGPGCYGFNWWVNGEKADGTMKLPGASEGIYWASGLNNNRCFVIPEWNMVVVRMGTDGNIDDADTVYGTFLKMLGEALMD